MAYKVWNKGDVFSIKMEGTGAQVSEWLETLVEDFEEPKFGYFNELWDEEDDFWVEAENED